MKMATKLNILGTIFFFIPTAWILLAIYYPSGDFPELIYNILDLLDLDGGQAVRFLFSCSVILYSGGISFYLSQKGKAISELKLFLIGGLIYIVAFALYIVPTFILDFFSSAYIIPNFLFIIILLLVFIGTVEISAGVWTYIWKKVNKRKKNGYKVDSL